MLLFYLVLFYYSLKLVFILDILKKENFKEEDSNISDSAQDDDTRTLCNFDDEGRNNPETTSFKKVNSTLSTCEITFDSQINLSTNGNVDSEIFTEHDGNVVNGDAGLESSVLDISAEMKSSIDDNNKNGDTCQYTGNGVSDNTEGLLDEGSNMTCLQIDNTVSTNDERNPQLSNSEFNTDTNLVESLNGRENTETSNNEKNITLTKKKSEENVITNGSPEFFYSLENENSYVCDTKNENNTTCSLETSSSETSPTPELITPLKNLETLAKSDNISDISCESIPKPDKNKSLLLEKNENINGDSICNHDNKLDSVSCNQDTNTEETITVNEVKSTINDKSLLATIHDTTVDVSDYKVSSDSRNTSDYKVSSDSGNTALQNNYEINDMNVVHVKISHQRQGSNVSVQSLGLSERAKEVRGEALECTHTRQSSGTVLLGGDDTIESNIQQWDDEEISVDVNLDDIVQEGKLYPVSPFPAPQVQSIYSQRRVSLSEVSLSNFEDQTAEEDRLILEAMGDYDEIDQQNDLITSVDSITDVEDNICHSPAEDLSGELRTLTGTYVMIFLWRSVCYVSFSELIYN